MEGASEELNSFRELVPSLPVIAQNVNRADTPTPNQSKMSQENSLEPHLLQSMSIAGEHSDTQAHIKTKLYTLPETPFFMYSKTHWKLHVRKEVFSPNELLVNPKTIHLIFAQIVREVSTGTTVRLTLQEIAAIRSMMSEMRITEKNVNSKAHKIQAKQAIIQKCKAFTTYFARIFPVSRGTNLPKVEMLGVSHSGLSLLRRVRDTEHDHLEVLETFLFEHISRVKQASISGIQFFFCDGDCLTLYSPKAQNIHTIVDKFIREVSYKDGNKLGAVVCEPLDGCEP